MINNNTSNQQDDNISDDELELLVAFYEDRLDEDQRDYVINQMAQRPALRKALSDFIISVRDDVEYIKKLADYKISLIVDYDIFSNQNIKEDVKKIVDKILEPEDFNLIDPLIDATIDNELTSETVFDEALGLGGIDSIAYIVVPVVVNILGIEALKEPEDIKEIAAIMIQNILNQAESRPKNFFTGLIDNFKKKFKINKLSNDICNAVLEYKKIK